MRNPPQYESEVRTAMLGSRQIRVENLTPVLSPQELAERRRELEYCLYDVFVKYADKAAKKQG